MKLRRPNNWSFTVFYFVTKFIVNGMEGKSEQKKKNDGCCFCCYVLHSSISCYTKHNTSCNFQDFFEQERASTEARLTRPWTCSKIKLKFKSKLKKTWKSFSANPKVETSSNCNWFRCNQLENFQLLFFSKRKFREPTKDFRVLHFFPKEKKSVKFSSKFIYFEQVSPFQTLPIVFSTVAGLL